MTDDQKKKYTTILDTVVVPPPARVQSDETCDVTFFLTISQYANFLNDESYVTQTVAQKRSAF